MVHRESRLRSESTEECVRFLLQAFPTLTRVDVEAALAECCFDVSLSCAHLEHLVSRREGTGGSEGQGTSASGHGHGENVAWSFAETLKKGVPRPEPRARKPRGHPAGNRPHRGWWSEVHEFNICHHFRGSGAGERPNSGVDFLLQAFPTVSREDVEAALVNSTFDVALASLRLEHLVSEREAGVGDRHGAPSASGEDGVLDFLIQAFPTVPRSEVETVLATSEFDVSRASAHLEQLAADWEKASGGCQGAGGLAGEFVIAGGQETTVVANVLAAAGGDVGKAVHLLSLEFERAWTEVPKSRSRKASRKKGGVRGGAVGAGPGGKYRWVDLHGLTVDQAVELLDRLLVSLRSKGERELHVITGRGKNSGDVGPRIKPAVLGLLREKEVQFEVPDDNNGLVHVYL